MSRLTDRMPEEGTYRQETVVEVVDTTRQRRILAAILLILMLLLAAIGWVLYRNTQPAGAPTSTADLNGLTWVRSIYAWGKSPSQLLDGVVDTAVSPDGTIWTVSSKTTLVGFAPNGTARKVITLQRGGQAGQLNSIEGIDVDENGDIYAADYGNSKVVVFDPNGRILREWPVELPTEISVRNGKVALAAAYGIGVFDTEGNLIAKWGSRGPNKDQVDFPHGIAWGDDGNIYVSDTDNQRLKAYTASGRLLWVYPKVREVAKRAGVGIKKATSDEESAVQLPAGMTVDASGRIVLVDPFEFKVVTMSTAGAPGKSYGEYGRQDGLFAYPTGIDYDPARDYYVVADTANNRLQVFRLPGSGGSVLARMRASFDGPIWLCSIPLALLLVAVVLSVRRRRRDKQGDSPLTDAASVTHAQV